MGEWLTALPDLDHLLYKATLNCIMFGVQHVAKISDG
tara:strand:+ start:550 stop:660 length:111 start_codon:yes stop_codon:yes gene_type:complete